MGAEDLLFVYGTLRPGTPIAHARMLAERATLRGGAAVRGRLYRIAHYPGFVAGDGDEAWIPGEVFELPPGDDLLDVLDAYEGCGPSHPPPHEFERIRVMARFVDETCAPVWVYEFRGEVDESRRIAFWSWPPR